MRGPSPPGGARWGEASPLPLSEVVFSDKKAGRGVFFLVYFKNLVLWISVFHESVMEWRLFYLRIETKTTMLLCRFLLSQPVHILRLRIETRHKTVQVALLPGR